MSPDIGKYHKNYDRLSSRYGGFLNGKAHFRGVVASQDLAGKRTQTEAMLLGFLGHFPEPEVTALFDALICLNVYPDPRIWTMRAGAYSAVALSPFSSAYSAAISAFNSRIYGTQPIVSCGKFVLEALSALEKGGTVKEFLDQKLEKNPVLPGFGRPVAPGPDERFVRSLELLAQFGFSPGPALRFIQDASLYLNEKKGIWPNFAAALAPILVDPPFSFTDMQLHPVSQCIIHIPLMFAVQDAAENYAERVPFLPLKVDDVTYTGPGERTLDQGDQN